MCDKCESGISFGDILKEMDLAMAKEKMVGSIGLSIRLAPEAIFEIFSEAFARQGWLPLLAYNIQTDMVFVGLGQKDEMPGEPGVLPLAEMPLSHLEAEFRKYKEQRRQYLSGNPVEGL